MNKMDSQVKFTNKQIQRMQLLYFIDRRSGIPIIEKIGECIRNNWEGMRLEERDIQQEIDTLKEESVLLELMNSETWVKYIF